MDRKVAMASTAPAAPAGADHRLVLLIRDLVSVFAERHLQRLGFRCVVQPVDVPCALT